MGPLRKSVSVRLEEGVHAQLRRQCLRNGVPTSTLVRALVHRWLDEQNEVGEATTGPPGARTENAISKLSGWLYDAPLDPDVIGPANSMIAER